jgi:hypothetical protein
VKGRGLRLNPQADLEQAPRVPDAEYNSAPEPPRLLLPQTKKAPRRELEIKIYRVSEVATLLDSAAYKEAA